MARKVITAVAVFILLALLLSVLPAQRTGADPDVDFVCKIRSSGGDYTTLSAWEAAIESDLTVAPSMVFTVSDTGTYDSATDDGDTITFSGGGTGTLKHINTDNKAYIVSCTGTIDTGTVTCDTSSHTFAISDTGDQIGLAIAECYNDWPSGLDDSLTISGWTADASHHVKVYAPESERHDGMMKSGTDYAGFTLVGSGTKISISALYTEIEGIALDSTVNYNTGLRTNWSPSGNYAVVHHCLFRNFGVPDYAFCAIIVGDDRDCKIYNNIFIKSRVRISNATYGDRWIYFYNNTLYDCHVYAGDDGVMRAKNNIAYRTDRDSFQGTFHADSDYNLSDDATAPGSHSLIDKTLSDIDFVETTYGDSQDLHIESTSDARDAGTDLSGDSGCPFANDIDYDTRTGNWDIGADECNQPPDIPTLVSPEDEETGVSLTPDLVFYYSDPDGDDCTKFDLKLADNPVFSSPEIDEADYGGSWASDSAITYSVSSPLSPGTQYYWKVRVFDGTDWSEWSDGGWDFTTNYPPDPPDDLGPTEYIDGGWGDDDTPTLEFTQSDPDGGDTVKYRIQIRHDIDGVVVDYTSGLIVQGATSFTVGQAVDGGSYTTGGVDQTLDEGEYYWQVMSIDEHDATGDWAVANGGEVAFRLDFTAEEGGTAKEKYNTQQDVRVTVGGFPPGATVDVYVVGDYAWDDGDDIPPNPGDTVFAQKTLTADIDGNIVNELIWPAPLKVGEYDIVFDTDPERDGQYDEILDLVDDPNHPGFTVVSSTVGGEVHPIDKATLLMPWLGLASAIILAGTLALIRRRTR
jgi:hypothetical protein